LKKKKGEMKTFREESNKAEEANVTRSACKKG
jgi:hypothetical protein